MPASQAAVTNGTVIKRGNGATPEVFTAIPEVTSIEPPSDEAAEIDVTHLTSEAREFKFGLSDNGTVTITGNYDADDATQEALRTDKTNKTLRNFQIVYPADISETHAFSAYVTQFKLNQIAVDQAVTFTAALRVSGAVTIT